uniref:hypothetical protein n=1 Tax=Xanthomonas sp. SHU 308 TaxID=1591201 RepID=UPI0005BBD98C
MRTERIGRCGLGRHILAFALLAGATAPALAAAPATLPAVYPAPTALRLLGPALPLGPSVVLVQAG